MRNRNAVPVVRAAFSAVEFEVATTWFVIREARNRNVGTATLRAVLVGNYSYGTDDEGTANDLHGFRRFPFLRANLCFPMGKPKIDLASRNRARVS